MSVGGASHRLQQALGGLFRGCLPKLFSGISTPLATNIIFQALEPRERA